MDTSVLQGPSAGDGRDQSGAKNPIATISDVFARYEWLSFGLLIVFYVWFTEFFSSRRALWFDELGTVFVATQPTLHALLHAEPPDGQPPLQYLLVRASVGLFGFSEAAVRLPALCGMLLALTTLYFAIRRRSGFVVAILILASWIGSQTGEYGAEARPYGLLLGFIALAYLCWQRAAESTGERKVWLAGLAAGVAGAVSVHPYGVVTIAFVFGTAEAVRAWQRRRIDWPVAVAVLCGAAFFSVTLWMGLQTKHLLMESVPATGDPSAFPRFRSLLGEYHVLTTFTIRYSILLAACALPLFGRRSKAAGDEARDAIPGYEWAAACALALSCCPIWLLTRLTNHYFWGRYGVASSLGIALCLGYILSGIKWDVSIPVAMTAAMLMLSANRIVHLYPPGVPSKSDFGRTRLLTSGPSQEPIVIASSLQFLQIWWYSPPELRPRIHFLLNHRLALRTAEFMADITLEQHHARESLPMPMDDLETFLAAHPSFVLYTVMQFPEHEWLPAELKRRGYSFTMIGGENVMYGPSCTLFEVHSPSVALQAAR